MPVTFKQKVNYTDPWTNNEVSGAIETSSIADKIPSQSNIYVLKPIVDTLTATIKVDKAWDFYQQAVPNHAGGPATLGQYLQTVFNRVHSIHDNNQWSSKFKRVNRSGNGFRYNIGLHDPKLKSPPVLNFRKTPPDRGTTFRMEFSASSLGPNIPKILNERWSLLDGGMIPFPALLASAKITRIDIAVDIINLPLCDLIPFHPKARTVWTAQKQLSSIETLLVYIPHGNKKTPHQSYKRRANLKIYDKKNQQEVIGVEPVHGELPHTRVEFGNVQGPKLKNLLKWSPKSPPEWRFFRHPHLDQSSERSLALLMDNVRVRGLRYLSTMKSTAPNDVSELEKLYPDDFIKPEVFKYLTDTVSDGALGKLSEWANLPMERAFNLRT